MATEFDRSVMLECASSADISSVTWRVGDDVIEDGDKYQVRRDEDLFYLRVSDVRCEDSGVYSCQIEDRNGRRAFTSAEVRVAGGMLFVSLILNIRSKQVQMRKLF